MIFRVTRIILGALCIGVCAFAHAGCQVDVVKVKGRIDQMPRHARVRVQLVYPKGQLGESGEVMVEDGTFSIPIEFLTQSRRPVVNGLFEKCDRKPTGVVVTLVENGRDQEDDRVSLDLARDFKKADPSAYDLRSEIVLKGPN